jgi:tRNA U34 5-methylaminomethyl-2-thiouridine-forming methyltransferase MnmC
VSENRELIPTLDGTLTLRLDSLGELYHNRAGAYLEAQINYAMPALDLLKFENAKSCTVLDACFGLGYNSLVFLQELLLARAKGELASLNTVKIEAVDNDPHLKPLLKDILHQACFSALNGQLPSLAMLLEGGSATTITDPQINLSFALHTKDLRDYLREYGNGCKQSFDLIFHDAFAPKKATELWTIDFFALYLKALSPSGSILTYSCAPAVRGALRELGFNLFVTPPLGSKPGGTLATRCVGLDDATLRVARLTANDEKKLAGSGKVPYRDPEFKLCAEQIKEARLAEQLLLDDARSKQILEVDKTDRTSRAVDNEQVCD